MSSIAPKSELDYYKLLVKKVWIKVKNDIPVPYSLSQNDAINIAELIKETTGRDINERTLRNAFKRTVGENGKLPSPYTLETLSQFVLDINAPEVKASPNWMKFITNGNAAVETQHQDSVEITIPNEKKSARRLIPLAFVILILITGFIWGVQSQLFQSKPENFIEDFKSGDLNYLKAKGWNILFPNYEWLAYQPSIDSGIFTLWTLPGDNWTKPEELKLIPNLMVHKLNGRNFDVELKIQHFYPDQESSQQIALFLLDKNFNLETCIRTSMLLYCCPEPYQRGVFVDMIKFDEGEPMNLGSNIYLMAKKGYMDEFRKMKIKLSVRKQFLTASSKPFADWESWHRTSESSKLNFIPAYVGIGAFQGWTLDDGSPKNADTIPVSIDYFKITYY